MNTLFLFVEAISTFFISHFFASIPRQIKMHLHHFARGQNFIQTEISVIKTNKENYNVLNYGIVAIPEKAFPCFFKRWGVVEVGKGCNCN